MEFWNDRWGRFRILKSLRPRLLLIVALALGPLALASIGQSLVRYQTRHEEINEHLLQTAMYATSTERSILSSVELQLQQLSYRPEIRQAAPDCSQTLAVTLIGRPLFVDMRRTDANGKTLCVASSAVLTDNYAQFAWWQNVKAQKSVVIGNAYYAPTARRELLPVVLPLHDASGKFIGALGTSVDLGWFNRRLEETHFSPVALTLILNREGAVVASNHPVSKEFARRVAGHGKANVQGVFPVKNDNGQVWQWAVQNVAADDIMVAFGVPEPGLFDVSRIYFLADILLPLLMIALASVAIWLGTEWLVIRWTTYLQRVSAAYAQNHFTLELTELETAPDEFRRLGHELKTMASSIRDRDRKLNRAIRQETAMAREIHHRVKNNLQIVSSLISLYSQRITDPQARIAFRQIVMRVNALTLVHRLIEKNDATPVIDVKALLTEMAEQMRATAAENSAFYRLSLNVEEISLPAATATPIALFTAEVLSFGLFKNDPEPRDVRLQFEHDGASHFLLTIEDNSFAADSLRAGLPSPQRFLGAYADQLQGCYGLESNAQGGSTLTLRIPIGLPVAIEKDDADDLAESPAIFHFRAPNVKSAG